MKIPLEVSAALKTKERAHYELLHATPQNESEKEVLKNTFKEAKAAYQFKSMSVSLAEIIASDLVGLPNMSVRKSWSRRPRDSSWWLLMVVFTVEGEAEKSTRSTRQAVGELEGVGHAEEVGVVAPESVVLSKTLDRILPDTFGTEVFTEKLVVVLVGGFRFLGLQAVCLLEGWVIGRGFEIFRGYHIDNGG